MERLWRWLFFLKNPDSRGTLVRPWLRRCRHSQTSFRGQARMSENTGLGILARCTSRGRRGTLEPVMRYFVAGTGLGRFRSLIPCACHATDSQHTVNTTVNTQSTRQSTRALFLRILSRSADLDSCSPNSSLRLGILKFPHATHVLLEKSARVDCRVDCELTVNCMAAI